MKNLSFISLIFCGFLTSFAQAGERIWLYPCDVFMSAACLRLPSGMSLNYEVPADFGIYTVRNSNGVVITAYVGNAPRLSSDLNAPTLELDSSDYKLRGFSSKTGEGNRLDIVLAPKEKGRQFVHLFSSYPDDQRTAVATLLSSLRPCRRPSREALRCPTDGTWGEALSAWILLKRSS